MTVLKKTAAAFGQTIRHNSSLSYISGLDGLRALAVFAVSLGHFTAYFNAEMQAQSTLLSVYSKIIALGWEGVDLFFALSGFLIASILAKSTKFDWPSYSRYVARRARRLLPAYVVCVAVVSVILLIVYPQSKVLRNSYLLWTFTTDIQPLLGKDRVALGDQYIGLAHFWTLALEWQFYLLFPFLALLFRSIGKASVVLICVAVITRISMHFMHAPDIGIYSFFFCRVDSLAFGALYATGFGERMKPHRNSLVTVAVIAFVAVGAGIVLSNTPFRLIPWMQIAGYSVLGWSFATMVWFIATSQPTTRIVRVLETPWIALVGRASYSIYIWHIVFYPAMFIVIRRSIPDLTVAYLVALVVGTVQAGILSAVSYRYIEWSMRTPSGSRRARDRTRSEIRS